MPPAVFLAAGAGTLSAGGQIVQGIQEKKAADAQAAALQGQAGLEREAAGAQISAQDYRNNLLMAQGRAEAGAAGVNPGSGSPKIVNMINASEAILQDTAARYSGNLKSAQDIAAAANARQRGRQALYGSMIDAGGTLLTTGLKITAPTGAGGLGFKPV